MNMRNWVRTAASLAACGMTVAALAYGSATMNVSANIFLRTPRPSPAVARMAATTDGTRPYIVRFTDAPVASYAGNLPGLAATSPHVLGRRTLDVRSGESASYAQYLAGRHEEFLNRAAQALNRELQPRFTYSYAFNGMALPLTPGEAAQIEALPGVQYLQPDIAYRPTTGVPIPATAAYTAPSRAWIGADTVWGKATSATGVAGASGNDNEGEGIVVADLDTGVNALNSSFVAKGTDNYTIPNPLGGSSYLGVCNSSEHHSQSAEHLRWDVPLQQQADWRLHLYEVRLPRQ